MNIYIVILSDYKNLICIIFIQWSTRRIASRHVNITMSAFVISETTNNNLAFESVANSFIRKTYLQAVSQKRQTVLAKLELPHFIEQPLSTAGRLLPGSGNSPP